MPDPAQSAALPPEILDHYGQGQEAGRLFAGHGHLERVRTQELLTRYLPPPPALIYDIGGGPGAYACWLARAGYTLHLVDVVPLHIAQAQQAAQAQPDHPLASATVGDARQIDRADASVDAVLLLGPLYHLTERTDRVQALTEARRILRPNGRVFAVGISRFASTFDGLFRNLLADPAFVPIMERDLADGQHRNPINHPDYFTTAFLHHPTELAAELAAAGLRPEGTWAIEGPGWLLPDWESWWTDPVRRARLLQIIRQVEQEPTLLGLSAHLLAIGANDR